MRQLLIAPVLGLMTGSLAAQATWIVDALSGPGTDFTTIDAAITAASNGDTIRVRPGSYTPPTIDAKAVTLLGDPGASLVDLLFGDPLTIRNIPTGQRVQLAGFASLRSNQFSLITPALIIDNVAGSVHLQDFGAIRIAHVSASHLITFTSCEITSLSIDSSTVALTDCSVTARGGRDGAGLTPDAAIEVASTTSRSQLYLAQTSATGAAGANLPPFLVAANSPAINSFDADLTIAGDDADALRAGTPLPGALALPAITGDSASQLRIDPRIVVAGNPGAPGISGPTLDPSLTISCAATGGHLGGTLDLTVLSTPNQPVAILLGLPGRRSTIPSFGKLWLSPAEIFLVVGQTGTGELHLPIPLPAFAPLTGLPLSFQAITALPNRALSGPTTAILR